MTSQEASVIERLCKADSPYDFRDWEKQNEYYITACRVSIEDVPHLINIASKWSEPDWSDSQERHGADLEDLDLLPVTAWRTLAELKSNESVGPLIAMLCEMDDEYDDWTSEELPHVFGKIGEPAIEMLVRAAKDLNKQEFVRSIVVRGLCSVAKYHAETRDPIAAHLTEMIARVTSDHIEFNSTLLVSLVELQAIEAAEPIERAFAGDLLDTAMMGNWEDVRRELGVEGLGLKMPENPRSSTRQLRSRMGFGIFSKQHIFEYGELNYEAEQAYYEQAESLFSKSNEAQQVVDRDRNLGWFQMLLEFGLNFLGETVDTMTVSSVSEFVLEHIPRKVSTEPEQASSILFELTMFWEYLDRVFELPEAKSIIEWLQAEGRVARLEAELSDPSNYGTAKSMFMSGMNAGCDMTTEAGIAEFMLRYNQSLQQEETVSPAETKVTRGEKIGRNAPCPCGSGKKYKKCCR